MSKRSSYEIKKKIISKVREGEATYAELERKINTGYRTIKANCEELEKYDLVKIKIVPHHPANGKPSTVVTITEKGLKLLQKEE